MGTDTIGGRAFAYPFFFCKNPENTLPLGLIISASSPMKKLYPDSYFFFISLFSWPAAQKGDDFASKTKGLTKYAGYFNFYWNEKTGQILLEIDRFNDEFLYVNSLPAGIGSNDLGHGSGTDREQPYRKIY